MDAKRWRVRVRREEAPGHVPTDGVPAAGDLMTNERGEALRVIESRLLESGDLELTLEHVVMS